MADPAAKVSELVRAADHERYLAALYAPAEKRSALLALYAFNAEIAAVRDRVSQPLPGEIRLQWWRDLIEADKPEAGGHPIAEALLDAIRSHNLPRQALLNALDARIFDLYDDPMPSRIDLEGYCGETAGALIQLSALVLDPHAAQDSAELAGHAGCAQAITGLLQLLPRHVARGQCYLPRDLLSAAGTTPEAFLADPLGPASLRAVAALAALAREHFSAFERKAHGLPASLRPAFLPLALTRTYLARIEGREAATMKSGAEISSLRRHILIFNRAARGW